MSSFSPHLPDVATPVGPHSPTSGPPDIPYNANEESTLNSPDATERTTPSQSLESIEHASAFTEVLEMSSRKIEEYLNKTERNMKQTQENTEQIAKLAEQMQSLISSLSQLKPGNQSQPKPTEKPVIHQSATNGILNTQRKVVGLDELNLNSVEIVMHPAYFFYREKLDEGIECKLEVPKGLKMYFNQHLDTCWKAQSEGVDNVFMHMLVRDFMEYAETFKFNLEETLMDFYRRFQDHVCHAAAVNKWKKYFSVECSYLMLRRDTSTRKFLKEIDHFLLEALDDLSCRGIGEVLYHLFPLSALGPYDELYLVVRDAVLELFSLKANFDEDDPSSLNRRIAVDSVGRIRERLLAEIRRTRYMVAYDQCLKEHAVANNLYFEVPYLGSFEVRGGTVVIGPGVYSSKWIPPYGPDYCTGNEGY